MNVEKSMGCTAVFNVAGVDKQKFLKNVNENPKTYADWGGDWNQHIDGKDAALNSPYLSLDTSDQEGDCGEISGTWSGLSDAGEATNLNLVHLQGYDCTNAQDLTKAEMAGRKKTMLALSALKKLEGFENVKLRNYGMTIGVRDTRKIVGRYNLTKDDVFNEARFDDSIGIFPEFIDGYSILVLPTSGRYWQVPYGALVPDTNNLLVAGRCCAGDHVSHASTRNMMCCTVTGQGAGVAAAVSIRHEQSTHDVDIKYVQTELRKQNVRIH